MDLKERNAQIELYLPQVKRMAARLGANLPPHVDRDDLYSSGVIGLVDAVEKFDASRGAPFTAYAAFRIRGAMLDELRRLDPTPRRVRAESRRLAQVTLDAQTELGRAPTYSELSERLGISPEAVERWQKRTVLTFIPMDREMDVQDGGPAGGGGTLHDLLPDTATVGARQGLEREEQMAILARLISELPRREQLVLAFTYAEGMELDEVGEALGITGSRVCQIRREAVALLRRRLAAAGEGAALRAA